MSAGPPDAPELDKEHPSSEPVPAAEADAAHDTLSHRIADLPAASRRRHARRLLLRTIVFAPAVLTSVLTSKAVAATKVVLIESIPLSL